MPKNPYKEHRLPKYIDTPKKLHDYFAKFDKTGRVNLREFAKRVSDITGYKYPIVYAVVRATMLAMGEVAINCDNTKFAGLLEIRSNPSVRMHYMDGAEKFTSSSGMQTRCILSQPIKDARSLRNMAIPGGVAGRKGLIIAENYHLLKNLLHQRKYFDKLFPRFKGVEHWMTLRMHVLAKYLSANAHFLGDNPVSKVFKRPGDMESYVEGMRAFSEKYKICLEYLPGQYFGLEYATPEQLEAINYSRQAERRKVQDTTLPSVPTQSQDTPANHDNYDVDDIDRMMHEMFGDDD